MKRQGKRAAFYQRRRRERLIARIARANRSKPGYMGVALNLKIGGLSFGPGALFMIPAADETSPALPRESETPT